MGTHRSKTAALAAVLGIAVIATPARSAVAEHWVVKDEPYAFEFDSCGFDVAVEGEFSEVAVVREGKGDADRAFPVTNRFGYAERWTNVETGEWFAIRAKTTFVEIAATHVEGNVFEFEFIDAGQPLVIRDSDGNVVARNRGAVHGTYLFDVGDDDAPGGEPVPDSGVLIKIAGPHPSLESDICEIATELIG